MRHLLLALLVISLPISCSPSGSDAGTPPELRALLQEYAGALEARGEALEQGDLDAAPALAVSAASILKRLQSEWRLTTQGVREACSDAGIYASCVKCNQPVDEDGRGCPPTNGETGGHLGMLSIRRMRRSSDADRTTAR